MTDEDIEKFFFQYPTLKQVLLNMCNEHGGITPERSEASFLQDAYEIVKAHEEEFGRDHLRETEHWLTSLSPMERHVLVDGEDDDITKIENRAPKVQGREDSGVGELLQIVFEDIV